MFEEIKKEIQEYLNLFSRKLQEVQENQKTLYKNQELLAKQNNKMIEILSSMDKTFRELIEEGEDLNPVDAEIKP